MTNGMGHLSEGQRRVWEVLTAANDAYDAALKNDRARVAYQLGKTQGLAYRAAQEIAELKLELETKPTGEQP